VIAFAGGGARHTVVPGLSGLLVRAQAADAFRRAIERFRDDAFDPGLIREHALQWDAPVFRARLVDAVEQAVASRPERGVSSLSVAADGGSDRVAREATTT
jgi:hypothetical protein